MYKVTIPTKIAGIPCLIGVSKYATHVPAVYELGGRMEYPPEGEAAEWDVLDRNGREAAWLDKKLTHQDIERIELEIDQYLEG